MGRRFNSKEEREKEGQKQSVKGEQNAMIKMNPRVITIMKCVCTTSSLINRKKRPATLNNNIRFLQDTFKT